MNAKTCTICSIEKPLIDFSVDLRRAFGRAAECKACKRKRLAIWKRKHRQAQTAIGVEMNKAIGRSRKKRNTVLRMAATSHGRRWTSREVSLALDNTLSAAEVAQRIGRTLVAVQHYRERMVAQLGIPSPGIALKHTPKYLSVT